MGWASGRILGTVSSNVKILKTCRVELETEVGDGSLEGIKAI